MTRSGTAAIAALVFGLGCGASERENDGVARVPGGPDAAEPLTPPGERDAQSASRPELECERRSFPCTWDKVPKPVYDRSHRLGLRAAYLVGSRGLSMDSVATLLLALDGVAEVQAAPTALRFRLEGGRALWVTAEGEGEGRTKGGGAAHAQRFHSGLPAARRSTAPLQSSGDRGLSAGEEGKAKHALLLTPYEWEFDEAKVLDLLDALRGGKKKARGYSEEMGGTVTYLSNPSKDVAYGSAGPVSPPDALASSGTVDLSAFEGWATKDFIYLSTHGRAICAGPDVLDPDRCWTMLTVGKFYDPQGRLLEQFGGQPGITVHYMSDPVSTPECAANADEILILGEDTGCSKSIKWTENASLAVTTEFFQARYGTGLPNSIVFLDACESLRIGDIGDLLVGGNKTFVFGFNRTVTDIFTKPIAKKVLKFILDGTPTDKWRKELSEELNKGLVLLGGGTSKSEPTGGATGATAGGQVASGRGARLRGRDIVQLHDPTLEEELDDGGSLRLVGQPEDGRPDSVHVLVRGVGLPDAEEATSIEVQFTLDESRELPERVRLEDNPAENIWQTERVIPLGFDAERDQVVDILLRGETGSGEFTEWPYEDIRLVGCDPRDLGDFEATVSGSHSRSIERGDQGANSGMRPDPQGGPEWILQIRNRTTSDLDFAVLLPEFPAAGAEYDLVDGSLFDDYTVMGGIAFGEDDQSAFHLGNVNVRFTSVSDDAACGTIFAELVGLQSGKTAAREAPATISARFWAEVRR